MGAIVILQQMEEHEWGFRLPRIGEEVHDRLEQGIDWLYENAERAVVIFRKLVRDYPEHCDAYHHLAMALDRAGQEEEAFEIRERAVKLALQFFPAHFSMKRDRLQWGLVENRPFLRLYQAYGWHLRKRGNLEAALAVCENLLSLNPNDNQGVRAMVTGCYFGLKQPARVLAVCRRYRQDAMEHVVYGRALALFQLGKAKEAGKAVSMAVKFYPLIAAELLKERHRKPKEADAQYVTLGSPQQAYLYWADDGRFWMETPGATDFLRSHLPAK